MNLDALGIEVKSPQCRRKRDEDLQRKARLSRQKRDGNAQKTKTHRLTAQRLIN